MKFLRYVLFVVTLAGCAPKTKPVPPAVPADEQSVPFIQRKIDVDVHDGKVKVDIEPRKGTGP